MTGILYPCSGKRDGSAFVYRIRKPQSAGICGEKHFHPYLVINSHGHPDHIGGNHWFEEIRAAKEEWDVLSLGNLHFEIISLKGHTKDSIGVLVQEEGILAAGDGLKEGLWLFNYGALSMEELYGTLKRTMEVPFDYYICGHSSKLYKRRK